MENLSTPKSLHAELKHELSKLIKVLKLPVCIFFPKVEIRIVFAVQSVTAAPFRTFCDMPDGCVFSMHA
jgi:hypothetical protein